MEIASLCALPASGFEWQPRPGVVALTVVCKATYLLAPGRSALSPAQDPPVEEDEHWDDDGARSLRAASDLAPYKPWADVVLVGPAYAPGKVAVRSFVVRLVVGAIDKSVVVWCDRSRRADGTILEGPPITKMPLRWERAAGGPHTDNPAGMRLDAAPDAGGRVAVPNLQPPGVKGGEPFAPVGLGPLAPRWPTRARALHGHTLGARWRDQPLPADFDYAHFNIAPPDQRTRWIQPDQRIALENLHPEHPFLVTALPGIEPRAVVDRATGEREEIALVADTLCFDAERGVCTVVWRGRIGLRHAGEQGRVVFWLAGDADGEALPPPGAPEPAEADGESLSETVTVLPASAELALRGLPFAPGPAPRPEIQEEHTMTLRLPEAAGAPLPFRAASPSDPVHFPPAPPREPPPPQEDRITLVDIDVPPAPILGPFARLAVHRGEEPAAPDELEIQAEETVSSPGTALRATGLLPEPRIEPPPPAPAAPAPPPAVPVPAPTVPEPPPPEPPEPPPFDPASFPLERWAALTARIALRRSETERILEEEGLTPERWAAVDRHHGGALQAESQRGRSALLRRSDAAYIEEIERLRGPITTTEYGKIAVSAERGTRRETMAALGLPMGAAIRIERVWTARVAQSPSLLEQTNEAVLRARDE